MLDVYLFRSHLADDEKVLKVVHKHWLMGITALFWPSIAFLACWVVFFFAPHRIILYLSLFGTAASAVWWVGNFFDYYLDAWLITNQGVIDLDWQGWFRRKSSRVLYSDVQGVSYEVQGITATLLRYGTITVEKISTGTSVSLPHVLRPRSIEERILMAMEEYLHSKNLKDSKHVQELLASMVAEQIQAKAVAEKKPKEVVKKKKEAFVTKAL